MTADDHCPLHDRERRQTKIETWYYTLGENEISNDKKKNMAKRRRTESWRMNLILIFLRATCSEDQRHCKCWELQPPWTNAVQALISCWCPKACPAQIQRCQLFPQPIPQTKANVKTKCVFTDLLNEFLFYRFHIFYLGNHKQGTFLNTVAQPYCSALSFQHIPIAIGIGISYIFWRTLVIIIALISLIQTHELNYVVAL